MNSAKKLASKKSLTRFASREAKSWQNYCGFPTWPNFSATFFGKFSRLHRQTGRFRFAGAKLLPVSDMAKYFRNFF
jgi:hypothetical protein